jgi:ribonuclease HI
MQTIIIYIDGLAEPTNPGIGTFGYVIYKDQKLIKSNCGFLGEYVSNNFAEYTALCRALKELINYGWQNEKVIVKSDSRLLVNQMTGWLVGSSRWYGVRYII